ncbi:Ig-like domain-containing protein, partial [Enterococcus casseliflavus]|uniref:Ig-like domain-containing protein n=1 Tax=Enterococcus casseliflavus TaxID=37734 RepID=UPI003D0CA2D7
MVTLPNSSAGPLQFTIGDFETAADDLLVTAVVSNQFLLPLEGISLGGSGSNRTVTVTPAPNQNGTGTVTIIVTDASSLSARATFAVRV